MIIKIWALLNNHGPAILASTTFAYLIVTLFILRESIIARLNQKIPVVVFRFRETNDGREMPIIEERIVNIGSGPALNISLKTNGRNRGSEFGYFNKSNTLQPMSDFPIDNVLGVDNGDPQMQICFLLTKGKSFYFKEARSGVRSNL